MDILTRQQWISLWQPIDPLSPENKRLSLSAYAQKATAYKAQAMDGLTQRQVSNSRYEAYIESLLEAGAVVPDERIAECEPEANRYHDVPLLEAVRRSVDRRKPRL